MAAAPPVKSYSIWVMPKGPLAEKLHGEVKQLAARLPGGAPTFLPHVTLLGGVRATEPDMLARAQQLAKQLKPYRIAFDRVAHGAIFHQCVYILCKADADTLQAGAAARVAFGLDASSGGYMPHLSLLYSEIGEEDRQCFIVDEQHRLFGAQQQQQQHQRQQQASLLQPDELGFDVSTLSVWETEESDRSLLSWRQLAEYPLQG